jgi:hypothetical protein
MAFEVCLFVLFVLFCKVQGIEVEGRRALVVAGNFTLDGERVNLAQFDIHNGV